MEKSLETKPSSSSQHSSTSSPWVTALAILTFIHTSAFITVTVLQFNELMTIDTEGSDLRQTILHFITEFNSGSYANENIVPRDVDKALSSSERSVHSNHFGDHTAKRVTSIFSEILKAEERVIEDHCNQRNKTCVKGAKGDMGQSGDQAIRYSVVTEAVTQDRNGIHVPCRRITFRRSFVKHYDGTDVTVHYCEKGQKGLRGENGLKGVHGSFGLPGPMGDPGEKGHKGDTGLRGPVGPPGFKGTHGEEGLKGLTGPQGNKGSKGEHGDKGLHGEKGAVGNMGDPGLQGIKGDRGEMGSTGPKGAIGEQGRKGPDVKPINGDCDCLQKPAFDTPSASDYVVLPLSQSAELPCNATGFPTPYVKITKTVSTGKHSVPNVTGSILIQREADYGTYTCVAENVFGKASKRVTVMKTGAKPVFLRIPFDNAYQLGSIVTYMCDASGMPPPEVHFFKDGEEVNSTSRLSLTKDIQFNRTSVTLLFQNLEMSDIGTYVCTANNLLGEITSESFHLNAATSMHG